jgi:serine/threonine protein kinase
LSLVLAAMHGIAEAHKQGVVHRDLKPDNIFLAREQDSAAPIAKVLDFGVSRLEQREGDDSHTITRTGSIIGTPAYMPLEQLRGDTRVDARADIYALGVVLYEGLTGRRPYEGKTDQELLLKLATEEPAPLRRHVPELDPELESIVLKALAQKPHKRYADVLGFARAIEAFRARPPRRRLRPSRRGSTLLLLTGLAVATLLAWLSMRAADAPPTSPRGAPRVAAEAPRPPRAPHAVAPSAPAEVADPQVLTPAEQSLPPPMPASASRAARPSKPAAPKGQDRATTLLPTDF